MEENEGFGGGRKRIIMWMPKEIVDQKKPGNGGSVAVAIDKDRSCINALKWAIDTLLQRGQTVLLIHVRLKNNSSSMSSPYPSKHHQSSVDAPVVVEQVDQITKDLFLPFRCFCTRKDIQCKDVVLEDVDVAKALVNYAARHRVENLVIGSSSKSGFLRFKTSDIPTQVLKGAPDFCSVYAISSKGKVANARQATRPLSTNSANHSHSSSQSSSRAPTVPVPIHSEPRIPQTNNSFRAPRLAKSPPLQSSSGFSDDAEFFRSPFTRGKGANGRVYGELSSSLPDSDISFVSSGRPSFDRMYPSLYDSFESGHRSSTSDFEHDLGFDTMSVISQRRSTDSISYPLHFSSISQDSEPRMSSVSSANVDDFEAEMRRLRMELKQTMELYSSACKEALTAKQMATELQRWKMEELRKYEEARHAEEAALAIVEREKAKSKAAMEAAEAAKRIAELEAQKRISAETKALKDAEEKKKVLSMMGKPSEAAARCRKYTIEEIEAATEYFATSLKIGEGGYGPVYKCVLDHTEVAIKVLRPDAAQGRSQFLQEVEVLSCIRHPHMVLLLGVCPEYGCLVYEYMANGSLEDCLFRRGNTPSLSWQLRFKIAAEIGSGLLFLHQTKPEPIVHRDLKPANILLDRNYVSKISDVGLARLVPPSVADTVTQYLMTSTAGTFCYIDPEYQQTGMLGVKSDIYSLGIIFLQLITARPPMGLTHHVGRAIEQDKFTEMLDPTVPDWPVEDALKFAKMALTCSELRRKDRPDLGKTVMPELNRLREMAEERFQSAWLCSSSSVSSSPKQVSMELGSHSAPSET